MLEPSQNTPIHVDEAIRRRRSLARPSTACFTHLYDGGGDRPINLARPLIGCSTMLYDRANWHAEPLRVGGIAAVAVPVERPLVQGNGRAMLEVPPAPTAAEKPAAGVAAARADCPTRLTALPAMLEDLSITRRDVAELLASDPLCDRLWHSGCCEAGAPNDRSVLRREDVRAAGHLQLMKALAHPDWRERLIQHIRKSKSVIAWAQGAITNFCRDGKRDVRRHEQPQTRIGQRERVEPPSGDRSSCADLAAHIDIHEVLACLPDDWIFLLIEHGEKGRSLAELAAQLGQSRYAVQRLWRKVKRHVKSLLHGYEPPDSP